MGRTRVAVLGAGIQGVCAALALQARGQRVDLIDQMPAPMLRASRCNEGKIHLGFVYANDPSLRTARLMAESALAFAPLLDGWVPGRLDWPRLRTRPFTYLVLADSLRGASELFAHYERVQEIVDELRAPGSHYLGLEPGRVWEPAAVPRFASPGRVAAAARTREASLDLESFRDRLVAAVGSADGIRFHPGRRIQEVARRSEGFEVVGDFASSEGNGHPRTWSLRADRVVNCLWEGRLEIDRQMGGLPRRPWVYRLKYRVLADLPARLESLPALTLVLGPFGDVVPLPGSSYVSWYPACRREWSSELRPPPEWGDACGGRPSAESRRAVARESFRELDRIVPGMREAQASRVDAGIVFSWGASDIDRLDSELHERHDVGLWEDDGYVSIDTGKFTCAPLFADRLARAL